MASGCVVVRLGNGCQHQHRLAMGFFDVFRRRLQLFYKRRHEDDRRHLARDRSEELRVPAMEARLGPAANRQHPHHAVLPDHRDHQAGLETDGGQQLALLLGQPLVRRNVIQEDRPPRLLQDPPEWVILGLALFPHPRLNDVLRHTCVGALPLRRLGRIAGHFEVHTVISGSSRQVLRDERQLLLPRTAPRQERDDLRDEPCRALLAEQPAAARCGGRHRLLLTGAVHRAVRQVERVSYLVCVVRIGRDAHAHADRDP